MNILHFNGPLGTVDAFSDQNGMTWFNAKQVVDALGLKRDAWRSLDEDEKQPNVFAIPRSPQKGTAINEPGLYKLILHSRKQEALEFKRWVTHDVLPSIRKNGGYILGQENLPAEDRKAMEEEIRVLRERVAKAENAKNKVEAYLNQTEENSEKAFAWYRDEAKKLRENNEKLESLQKIIISFAEALGSTGMFEKFIKQEEITEFDVDEFWREHDARKRAYENRPKKIEKDPFVMDAEGMVLRQSELLSRDKRNWLD